MKTAKEFDKLFESGEDITEFVDENVFGSIFGKGDIVKKSFLVFA